MTTPQGPGGPRPTSRECDALVVGCGPAGASAAYWLASSGIDVLVVEKSHHPRDKSCGDGLTPRSVLQLNDMGLGGELAAYHRCRGLRANAYGRTLAMDWPDQPGLEPYGYVVARSELDALVAGRARQAGARLWQGAEALAPLAPARGNHAFAKAQTGSLEAAGGAIVRDLESGTTTEVRARYVIIADGSLSRFGKAIGTARNRNWPQGLALRGYYRSQRDTEDYIDSFLDIRDATGRVVPGYGWIFPMGDGRVNVGVGLLSTQGPNKGANTTKLMENFLAQLPASWGLGPETSCGAPVGGRLPMGLSVGPRVGPDCLVVGDAAGLINPFNGEGIAYAYESGRLAAGAVADALASGDSQNLAAYEQAIEEIYGMYFRVGRAFVKLISRPRLMGACVNIGMHNRPIMEWMLRIMANYLRPEELGPAEALYGSLAALAARKPAHQVPQEQDRMGF